MHVAVFSYKPCWPSADSASGFVTDGGFPLQIARLSQLFDRTTLLLPRRSGTAPAGTMQLAGRQLQVETFAEPACTGVWRKLWWLVAGLWIVPRMWRLAGQADVVHALVPGDAGFLGLVVALARRRRIFVRHCGTWGRPATTADRLLHRLLLRAAGERCLVFATGGGDDPPVAGQPAIQWIFSTSLSRTELEALAQAQPSSHEPARLICVGRLTRGKNVVAALEALAEVRRLHPGVVLDVVGGGPEEAALRRLAEDLGLAGAVSFHGNVDHAGVLARLRRASILVFPTRVAEGFPKAVLEALACGVPVVVPRVSVLPHLLRDGGGVVIDDVAPATVARAVLDLLDGDSLGRHAAAGRRLARRYTLEAWGEAIGRRLEQAWGEPLSTAESEGP